MEAPKPETLMWVEFLWRVTREAPEVLAAWITIYLFWEQLHTKKAQKGRRLVLNWSDSVRATDSFGPLILPKLEAHGKATTRLELSAGDMAVLNSMAYTDTAFPQF
jgi:hypothetical protein